MTGSTLLLNVEARYSSASLTGSGSALWSHPRVAFSPSSLSSLTGSQPSSSTNKLSDLSVGGGGFCDGRKSKADMRDALALTAPTWRGMFDGGGLAEAEGGGACDSSLGGCGASDGATLVLRDTASSRGP